MIELQNVTIETRHPILNDVNYTFQEGKIYGVVAENGSGKTTLFRAMVNLLKVKQGMILFDGQRVEHRLGDVFYFENIEWLDRNLSGMDYFKFVKTSWKSDINIDEVINLWDMDEYVRLPIRKYSLGMKQRVVIGMYIISNASYMIMDEITNGLDEDNRKHFFKQIHDLKEDGKTILLSSHYKEEIMEACDVVLQIKQTCLHEVTS